MLLHIWMLVSPNSVGFEVGVVVGAIFGLGCCSMYNILSLP